YDGRVPGGADLVCYWFEKARAQLAAGKAQRAGLVATQAIRKGANRIVLERILNTPLPPRDGLEVKARIFNAWSDEPWVNDGAAVRVSLVCFGSDEAGGISLDGHPVATINADLTAGETDLTKARRLAENAAAAFRGADKIGAFDIPGELARQWLPQPNPHGRPNRDVLRPWANGMDITRRPSDTWIIDFGGELSEAEAALYEAPFAYVLAQVKPERERNRRALRARYWWRHGEVMPGMRKALARVPRYIATPRVAKHRLFVWLHSAVLPDSRLYVIARDDDSTFGILHSRIHEVWALANASRHGDGNEGGRPTYNAATCFETFPFPAGLQPNQNALTPTPLPQAGEGPNPYTTAIVETARRLNALRQNWLNPPEWVERVPEIVPGYPDRLIPKPEFAAELNRRTLTHLYNTRPAWLDQAHRQVDAAVAAAYGWDDYQPAMPDAEILRRLLALNRQLANGFEGDSRD
ncbi:MAG: class I SAM-dependent DNA methyltransferase, partial [Candidatus Competibacter sp.]|nr:class I SAM-dependent DNA methyltransferase [Candidatus Competibacter sp.]